MRFSTLAVERGGLAGALDALGASFPIRKGERRSSRRRPGERVASRLGTGRCGVWLGDSVERTNDGAVGFVSALRHGDAGGACARAGERGTVRAARRGTPGRSSSARDMLRSSPVRDGERSSAVRDGERSRPVRDGDRSIPMRDSGRSPSTRGASFRARSRRDPGRSRRDGVASRRDPGRSRRDGERSAVGIRLGEACTRLGDGTGRCDGAFLLSAVRVGVVDLPSSGVCSWSVSYTHLTLPTNREV